MIRFLATAVAISAVGVAALTGNSPLATLLCLAALVLIWRRPHLGRLSAQRMNRLLVACAVLVGAARDSAAAGEPRIWLIGTGLILLILISGEHRLKQAVPRRTPWFANLDVRGTAAGSLTDGRFALVMSAALLVGDVLAAGLEAGDGVLFGAGVFALSATEVLVRLGGRVKARAEEADEEAVWKGLERFEPRFAVHFSAPAESEYQLLMWLPLLDRLDDGYVVILREKGFLPLIAEQTSAPVVVASKVARLERALVPSIRSVFYVNNGMKNSHCVRFGHLTHVQLLHGDSDKPSSYSPVTAMFDQIFVAGQAGIDRYSKNGVDIPADRFRIVGRPQLADIVVEHDEYGAARGKSDPVVLYAPTWIGAFDDVNYCSLPIGEEIVGALLRANATVILRPHPYTMRDPASAEQVGRLRSLLAADAVESDRRHVWEPAEAEALSLTDCINRADAMVCDVSAVAVEWLYSEKPFAITDMQNAGAGFAEEFPLARAAYRVRADGDGLKDVMSDLLDDDPLMEARRKIKSYYLGDAEGEASISLFLDAVRATYSETATCVAGSVIRGERP